ncbi:putative quinol monooxygenase [Actinoplanes auranticolor]|uniref:Antibiotic biosynthesis monooxygenase n=1 Tax=Actinoplanes auranticolor TaxID=47988 RepID=A0A919S6I6_9ACTN|nr:antibiotic biosynthesis monooxygenase family protein [Actinoplanes auranticolor]GIM66289.1 antibiotic biosynthesis monooxygenase [Actinoplanes auranticolor]
MILEIAELSAKPGSEKDLAEAHATAMEAVGQAEGMLSARLTQGVETPTNFVLLVEWTDLAAHERFRGTEQFAQWRAAIGQYVTGPAAVQHTRVVA